MRVFLLIMLCLLAVGCNSDPRCRRETALLRAEILDLEDKYYLLKADRDAIASGRPPTIQSESYYTDTGEPYVNDGAVVYDGSPSSEIIYEGSSYDGSTSYEGSNPYNDGVVLNSEIAQESNLNAQPLMPDDSILPLHSSSAPQQNLRDAPSVMRQENEPQNFSLQLPENMSNTGSPIVRTDPDVNGRSNVLLNSPEIESSEFEIGFEQTQSYGNITEVVINDATTRGHDVDGVPGDEGLDVLIQPRSADGQIQLVAGDLTVSVLDPNEAPEKQRIGTWKFLSSETELFFANDELGSYGILLHLPWDQNTPVNQKLIVHVRFITQDGRSLETSSEVRITPPQANYSPNDPLVTGWTRRDSRWLPGSWLKKQSARASDRPGFTPARPLADNPARRLIPASPAKATISKPAWRPIR